MRSKLAIILAILFVGFVGLGVHDIRSNQVKLKLNEVKLEDQLLDLNEIKLQKEELNQKFEEATSDGKVNEEKVKQLEKEKLELEEKTRKLESELQAKREAKNRIAGVGISNPAHAATFTPTGNKEEWLRASGIPESEWWAVDWIVSRESGWKPCAYYPGQNDCGATPVNACGLVQQNPCHKIPGDWRDPVAALKWQATYVKGRYGGYAGAVAYWKVHGHY